MFSKLHLALRMISGLGDMSWATACNRLVTVYSETAGNSSSSFVFKSEGNFLLFETTLRLPVTEYSHVNSYNNDDDDDYLNHETDFETDPSALQTEKIHNVKLSAIIMPHPVYSVPCPYIEKMWNESGKVYSLNECQDVVDCVRRLQSQYALCKPTSSTELVDESEWNDSKDEPSQPNTTTVTSTGQEIKDNRYYEFGRLTPETHPITGFPCFSMHLCHLQDILKLSEQSLKVYHNTAGYGIDTQRKEDLLACLYLLNWCTIVGPHFGLFISPSQYTRMVVQLTL